MSKEPGFRGVRGCPVGPHLLEHGTGRVEVSGGAPGIMVPF